MVIRILLVNEDVQEPHPYPYNYVAIVIKEEIALHHLRYVPNSFVKVTGLLYPLNLDYPKDLSTLLR